MLRAPCVVASSRVVTTYWSGSKLRSSSRNLKVVRGHSVVLRPWESRYQLAQPPVLHTVRFIRRCTSAFQASCASWRTSTAPMPRSPICWRAERM